MKILLLGEYSALHTNLKEGLLELGHDITLAGYGDGFKKIPLDLNFDSDMPWILSKLSRKIKPLINIKKLENHDILQLMNPFIFYHYFPSKFFHEYVFRNNSRSFLLAAGDDAYFWKYGRKKLAYGPFDDFLKYDIHQENYYMDSHRALEHNNFIINHVEKIIPIAYEYKVSYESHPKISGCIPIPINTNKIKYTENIPQQKLVIFHGLNRYGFKGTRHIEQAFSYLQEKYPNDIECIIDGKMPLDKYLSVMKRANIIIDQANSYSCGVNAIYALAMGKIVMGGAEPESLLSLGVSNSPVINIKPSAASIIQKIQNILDIRQSIPEIGYRSRQFVEENHCYLKVAQKYLDAWM